MSLPASPPLPSTATTAFITDPFAGIDCEEIFVPFSWFEPMWWENLGFAYEGQGWKLTQSGATALDSDLPVNMSGGVLSSRGGWSAPPAPREHSVQENLQRSSYDVRTGFRSSL